MAEHSERREVLKVRTGPTTFDSKAFDKIAKRRQNNPEIMENDAIAKAAVKKTNSQGKKSNDLATTNFVVDLPPSVADSHPLDVERDYGASFSVGKLQKPVPASRKAIPQNAAAFSRDLSSNLPLENLRQYYMPFRIGRPKELNRFVRDDPLLSRASDFVTRFELDLFNQSHLDRLESLLAFEFGKNALTLKGRIETAQAPVIKPLPFISIPASAKPQSPAPLERIRARRIATDASVENAAEEYRNKHMDSEGKSVPNYHSRRKPAVDQEPLKESVVRPSRKPPAFKLESSLVKVFTRVVRHYNGMHPSGSRGWVSQLMKTESHKTAEALLKSIEAQHKLDSSEPQNERRLVELLSKHALQSPARKSEWEALLKKK